MKDYQKRVIEERDQLQERVGRLYEFMEEDEFCNLPDAEKDSLNQQLPSMCDYLRILNERIANF